jgi:hypothetical protein
MVAAHHKEKHDQLTSKGDRVGALELTVHSNPLMSQLERRREEAAPLAPTNSDLGENGRKWKGGGEGKVEGEMVCSRPWQSKRWRGQGESIVDRAYL